MTPTRMALKRIARLGAGALAAIFLVACGSGGSGTFNNPPAPGTYAGNVYNSGANAHRLVIRDGGTFWILLGSATSSRFGQNGFVVGSNLYTTDYASGTLFDASNPTGVLVNMNTAQNGGLTSISGNIQFTDTGATSTFDGRNYSLSGFSTDGLWTVSDAGGRAINLNLAAGVFSATTASSCVFSGSLTSTVLPGFYDARIDDSGGCLGTFFATYSGIAVTETPPSGFGQQLMIAAVGNGRGISLSGVR